MNPLKLNNKKMQADLVRNALIAKNQLIVVNEGKMNQNQFLLANSYQLNVIFLTFKLSILHNFQTTSIN